MEVPFPPGTLAATVEGRIAAARASGALCPIRTVQTVVEDGGVRFLVRAISSLARKLSLSLSLVDQWQECWSTC